ncbi:hypothetical protein J7E50_01100 [Pedobacter sp. ISL-68]|uniref:hypothetical protein n=1 Tax=unclassified Pedobacter TaxID=2628915 RepID=UPI001BE6CECB|nr:MULTISPECIES: hypothetical protein [unclassified Pedobacter]MBT2564585.1 hypothetical protein [Pedobacter sp. ISL-64]MBT2588797.1 hypothetical protein [Pedobacter sp. ISL-68]
MAKSGKVVQLFQKPENFIKSRARELELGHCYITEEWEETGIANILVSRKHTNGNFTLGIYLIDLKCLGIKDTMFKFNVTDEELDYFADYVGGNEIEYNEVHNIIYGAEAFAKDCGFKAHKDWTITQFILEEDNDRIPLIDVEFGEDGIPAYYVGPNDSPAKVNQILATLDKHVGQGNYLFYNDEDEFEDDEIIEDDNEQSFKQIYYTFTGAYRDKFGESETATLDKDHIVEIWGQKVDCGLYSLNDELDDRIIECAEEYESIFEDKSVESISQIHALLIKNPDMPLFYAELFLQYKMVGLHGKADAIAKKGMQLFPDFLYLRLYVAHAAMIDRELKKGLKLLNNNYKLDEAFPKRTAFSEGEFMLFYAALCQYFIAKGNLINAIICSDALIAEIYKYACSENAVLDLLAQVKAKLGEVY